MCNDKGWLVNGEVCGRRNEGRACKERVGLNSYPPAPTPAPVRELVLLLASGDVCSALKPSDGRLDSCFAPSWDANAMAPLMYIDPSCADVMPGVMFVGLLAGSCFNWRSSMRL